MRETAYDSSADTFVFKGGVTWPRLCKFNGDGAALRGINQLGAVFLV